MSDYNWSSPTAIGMEWQPITEQALGLTSPATGVGLRFRPGSNTLTAIHRHHPFVYGSAPGYALEVLDVLAPTVTTTSYFPGTDVSATGWETQSGAAGTYTVVDDKIDTSTYLRNTGTFQTYEQRSFLMRGSASALSGKRIAYIALTSYNRCVSFTTTSDIGIEGVLNLSGNNYYGPVRRLKNDAVWYTTLLGAWRLNPSTNEPWTQAEVNLLIQAAGTDEFGMRVSYPRPSAIDSHGMQIAGLWVDVVYATENRVGGYYYNAGKVLVGWQRFALTGAGALSANTWYWLVEYPLIGGSGNHFSVQNHRDPLVVEAASASATIGEHRQTVAVVLQNGIVVNVAPDVRSVQNSAFTSGVAGQQLGGVLYEVSGPTIISQSNPYITLERRKIATDAVANICQRVTGANGTAYGAVQLPVAWNRLGVKPDRELTIEVRHGNGAEAGGGTLDATATLIPSDMEDGTLKKYQVNFATAFTSTTNTQYTVKVFSLASTWAGWDIVRLDTRSDMIDPATSTTAAQIHGASQGGTTDTYIEGSVTASRYDLVCDLIAAPTTPSGLTVTAVAAVPGLAPPQFHISWTATSLTTGFSAYRVYGRPSRSPAATWQLWFEIDVGDGQTAATVEAQHNKVRVYDAGWSKAGGQWADGWDFGVSVVNANTGLESVKSTSLRNTLTPDTTSWLANNDAPWLNLPLRAEKVSDTDAEGFAAYQPLGRDLAVTRMRGEIPARVLDVPFNFGGVRLGEDPGRYVRSAVSAGRPMALLMPNGDRFIGAVHAAKFDQSSGAGMLSGSLGLVETARQPKLTDYNLPAGLVLNGSSQYITHGDAAALDPGSSAFTVVVAAVWANSASTRFALTKGAVGVADGYGLGTTGSANQVAFYVDGASASGSAVETSAVWFDGNLHVAVGTSSGTAQGLYRDGNTTAAATASITHGSISNAVAFVAGANNAGGSGFMACAPLQSYAVYLRVLTATEIQNASYYLLGYPGHRMPAGAALFVDLRDARCWNGLGTVVNDLSGNVVGGTTTASPTPRGMPWTLAALEK